jgi:hypothetical protein
MRLKSDESQEVASMREKFGKRSPASNKVPYAKRSKVVEESEGSVDEGEDEISVEAHLLYLGKAFKARKPCDAAVLSKMKRTFPGRWNLIKEREPILTVLEQYPYLATETAFLQDFQQITGRDALGDMEAFLVKHADKIIYMSSTKPKVHQLHADHELIMKGSDPDAATRSTQVTALLSLPSLLREQCDTFILKDAADVKYPFLMREGGDDIDTTYSLWIDQVVVLREMTGLTAVTAWFAAYWVADIVYAGENRSVLTFLEHAVYKLKSTTVKPGTTVDRLLQRF